ncbi:flagellar filament capping protein FliD [Petroclostridium sp. X23]|uniref:flagellar filament capping protein FliD n=1 Tax=Petroclostridium sp. X23 TaxID=3045146 RepID=UPI0024AD24C1|nr:flagellar filament capping protein FliD [Petroclostridium sp. X23]WHH58752.1 flagellar filament capping protein FliD [Petroclostridium sp. X23]
MSSISSISSSTTRITGMASGLDVDTIVEELMTAEKVPLNKLYQKKQLAEWKRDNYREISNALRAFSDEYFDILNSDSYMLSQSTYKKYTSVVSDNTVVSVTANAEAEAGTHSITVSNLATAAIYKSSSAVTKAIAGSSAADFSAANGKSFILTVDGTKKTIDIDDSNTDISSLQQAVDDAIGTGKVLVSDTVGDGTGYLTFSAVENSGVSKITLSEGTDGVLSALGFSDDDNLCNRLKTSDTLESICANMQNIFSFNDDGNIAISINGTDFEFDKDTTLSSMMSKINSSDAGVRMTYNETKDIFMLMAITTGAGKDNIQLSESGSTFLENACVTDFTEGEDAVIILDGEKHTRSSNSITQDGVTYKLLSESTEEQTVGLSLDTDGIYDKIKSFIDDYNALINTINDKISEEYDSDYPPLTDDEKEAMTDDEIELWENQAKTGLLENDSTLQKILDDMRWALYQSVEGSSLHLSSIGITTTSNYEDKGKLEVDETALKKAIENNPEAVANLFSKKSESYPGTTSARTLDSSQRSIRQSEEGLIYRIYDVLQDNISTMRNNSGKKGTLLEKAGIEGDTSSYSNFITDQIEDYEEEIDEMLDKLDDKEDQYYEKFSNMETYINQMNSQLSSIQSMLG